MDEGRSRLVALIGTIALHVLVVWWLATSPEAAERILRAVEMDVVDLTPEPEPESEAEPEVEQEPEPEPDPQPEKVRPSKNFTAVAEPEEVTPDEHPPEEASEVPPSPPPVIDFGEQNFASQGAGTGWGMKASHGGSRSGVYRPGSRGGTGTGGGPATKQPTKQPRRDFAPVPLGSLSRHPEAIGRIDTSNYPAEARRQFIEGTVRLEVEIRANGRVRGVRVLSDPGGGLGPHAAAQVRRLRWRPALDRRGQQVDARITYTVRYILDY